MNRQGFTDLDSIKDLYLGKQGTRLRDQYEFDLKLDILGDMIRFARKDRNLTQEQLGDIVGVKKSEISKLERNARNMTIGTILRIFNALNANIKFIVKLEDEDMNVA
jgi:HTH-type transcriptional regulator/antitoxin HipB